MGGLNPRWNEDSSNERADAQFQKAVQLTGSEFLESVDYLAKVGVFSTLQHSTFFSLGTVVSNFCTHGRGRYQNRG